MSGASPALHGHADTTFQERVAVALSDGRLQGAVRLATERIQAAYAHQRESLPEFGALRQRASEIRRRTLEQLDSHLARLADQMVGHGCTVYFADDAASACAYIVGLAQREGVRMVVKSKSMIGEEIEINHALEQAGITPVETDLGEFICQLAQEPPSHLLAPAMHKTRGQIADLFSTLTGRPVSDDPEQLTALARTLLREKFLTADMGISGVNFGVAESGTLTLVSNEGNGRMCTSVPRLHVALMGMERVVPTWEDLAVLMRILPLAATGQPISTYYSLLSGPRRSDEPDGPEQMHVVIVDNGRSQILGTEFQDILRCIRCGACLNVCPIYRNIGGHAYGTTYSGPIGAVLSPLLLGDQARDLPYASSLCGACTEVCPVGIPLHDLLIEHRARDVERRQGLSAEHAAFSALSQTWQTPALYRLSAEAGAVGLRALSRGRRWIPLLPGPGAAWTEKRDFPTPPGSPFHTRWQQVSSEQVTPVPPPDGENAP